MHRRSSRRLRRTSLTISASNAVKRGSIVVKCGDAVVMTEKVFVENKDKSRLEVERILREAFRCDILFLPWDRQEYLGHSDGIVHYAGDGRVLLTNYDDFSPYFYRRFRKALETRFEVIPLLEELACKQSVPF